MVPWVAKNSECQNGSKNCAPKGKGLKLFIRLGGRTLSFERPKKVNMGRRGMNYGNS